MPFTGGILETGADLRAHCVVPSFTNPNNISIVTGVAPSVHGICGNFFYDRETDSEVMMNDPRFLRAPTIFQAFAEAGAGIAVITAKDKLRPLLGHGLDMGGSGAVCFSAEKADQASPAENGIGGVLDMVGLPLADVYSAGLSEFIFAAGVEIMERRRPDIMYLSSTDYVQHKHAPGTEAANDFYRMLDGYWARLHDLGVLLAITADHGMSAKHDEEGRINVIYLQDVLDDKLGTGAARVILPITDPYVVHHGALGGFATAYLPPSAQAEDVARDLESMEGVECALTAAEACRRFELPGDRLGDIVVVTKGGWAVGSSPDRHDLSGLTDPLRSHGGIAEQVVPLIFNRPLAGVGAGRKLRNFDAFDLALNHAQ